MGLCVCPAFWFLKLAIGQEITGCQTLEATVSVVY